MASDNTVQIVIQAKDVASDVIKKAGLAFTDFSKATTDLSQSLVGTGNALQATANYTEVTKNKLASAIPVITAYGAAITAAFGSAAVLSQTQFAASVDRTTSVFNQLEQEGTKLSQSLVDVASVFTNLTALVTANVNANLDLILSSSKVNAALQLTTVYVETVQQKIASTTPVIAAYSDAITATLGAAIAALPKDQINAVVDSITNVFIQLELESAKLSQYAVEVKSAFNGLTTLVAANVNANLDLILSSSEVNAALQLTASYVEAAKEKIASAIPVITAYSNAITAGLGNAIAALPKDQINTVLNKITGAFEQLGQESTKLFQSLIDVDSIFQAITNYGSELATTFDKVKSSLSQKINTESLAKTDLVVENLSKQTTAFNDNLTTSKVKFDLASEQAKEFATEITETGIASIRSGAEIVAAAGVGVAGLYTLNLLGGQLRETLGTPIAQNIIQLISQQADAATKELVPLSDILTEISTVGSHLGAGFTQGLFGVKDQDPLKQINDELDQSFNRLNQKIRSPISKAFGTINNAPSTLTDDQKLQERTSKQIGNIGKDSNYTNVTPSKTTSTFKQVDSVLASLFIDKKISEQLGIDASNNFVLGFIKNNEAARNLLSAPLQELLKGSLLNAILKIPEEQIATNLNKVLKLAFDTVEQTASLGGSTLAVALFKGIEGISTEEKARLLADQEEIRKLIGGTFDGVGKELIAKLNLSGAPGEFIAKGLGNAIDGAIPKVLTPIITTAARFATKQFKEAGANAVTSLATAIAPDFLKDLVKTTFVTSGLSQSIIEGLTQNIKPSSFSGAFNSIIKLISNPQTLSVPNALVGFTVNFTKVIDQLFSKFTNGLTSLSNAFNKLRGSPLIDVQVDRLQAGIQKAIAGIGFLQEKNKAISIDIAANGADKIRSLVQDLISLKEKAVGIGVNVVVTGTSVIESVVQSIVFLQEKAKEISVKILVTGANVIESIIQSIISFPQVATAFIESGITNIFAFIDSVVINTEKGVQSLLSFVSNGINSIDSIVLNLASSAIGLINNIKRPLSDLFGDIDYYLGVLRKGLGAAESSTPLKSSLNAGDSVNASKQYIDDAIANIQSKFALLDEISSKTLSSLKDKILNAGNSFGDFAKKSQVAIASISDFASVVSANIQKGTSSLSEFILSAGIFNKVPTASQSAAAGVSAPTQTATANAPSTSQAAAAASVSAPAQAAAASVSSASQTAAAGVSTASQTISQSLLSAFTNPLTRIKAVIGEIVGVVTEGIGRLFKFLFDKGEQENSLIVGFVKNVFGETFIKAFTGIGQTASTSFATGFLGGTFKLVVPAIDLVDKSLLNVYNTLSRLPSKIAEPLSKLSAIPAFLGEIDQPLIAFGKLQSLVGTVTNSIFAATQSAYYLSQGFSTLQYAGAAPFEFLIGQTVKLREQLLSTQSSLVATSKIFDGFTGKQVTDPTKAIQSLELPINTAVNQLRIESLDLVGITSNDLIPLYQQIAGQITAIGGTLGNAKDLSLDFAAALGTLQVPLNQSRQEIGSILMGTIDQNSVLAKSLNISNEQVNNWKSQGRLVEELRAKLQPFRAGNALAAASLSGVTSNIQEIFQNIGRLAGEPLLDPLLKQVNEVYEYLKVNQDQFVAYFGKISEQILRVALAVVESAKAIFSSIGGFAAQIPLYLFTTFANVMESVAEAIKFTSEVLAPAIHFITELATFAAPLSSEFLQLFASMTVLSGGVTLLGSAFGSVTRLVPGLNNVIYALDIRTNGIANQFVNLTKVLGTGGGGFLILGKYLNSIPGASEAASLALGPLGATLVGFIPTIADIGIQVAGLIILFPALGVALSGLISALPAFLTFVGTLVSQNIFLAPLAPLFFKTAVATEVYADASTRGAKITILFTEVLKNVGRAIAGQILSFGLLAGGAYLAFLAFDHFVLQNESVKEVLEGVVRGLGVLGESIKIVFGSLLGNAIVVATAFGLAIRLKLLLPITELIASTLAGWAIGVAGALGGLATTLSALGLTGLAASASTAAVGVKALSIAMTEGAVASGEFLTVNGISTVELFGFSFAADTAAGSVAIFATALYTAIAPLLALLAPLVLLGALIAGIAFAAYNRELTRSREDTELLTEQTERLSQQAIKTASDLKKAGDIQAEADKRGVRLSDEQYKANEKLVNQAKLRRADLDAQLVELKSQLGDAVGDAEKGRRQQLIAEMQERIKLLDSLVGNVKIKPIDLERLGSAYEQLANLAAAAEDALTNSSGDPAIFKKKAEELISVTEKQSEAGEISSAEAIRRYNLVAANAAVSSDVQQKAQEGITKALKQESDKRIGILQAEQAAISAQLASGRVDYEKNATAIADAQNSILKSRLEAEQQAHDTKLKQIQKEFDNQTFVNTSLLKQKEEAARTSAEKDVSYETNLQEITQRELNRVNGALARKEGNQKHEIELEQQKLQLQSEIEASKTRQSQAQDTANKPIDVDVEGRKALSEKIAQIEKDKNLALNAEAIRSARIASELSSQIAENEAAAAKFAADLRIKVKTGAISQELAAERQLTFAKKTELETQLRNSNDTYDETRKGIEANFATTTKFLEDAIAKKQAEADKLPEGSKEYEAAQADITVNNTKLISSSRAKNSALTQLELNHKTEVLKINADISKNQSDSAEKEASIAIKILERNQKKTLDAVQKAQNERIIQIQQLENKGLLDHTEVEEKKTEASKINIAAQLNEERLRLKALQALPRPKNQEKGADFDTQIRASQLKVQDLVKQSLDAELNLYHQHIATILDNVKDEDNIRETQLENQSRRGLLTQAQVTEELARRKVASLEKNFALETKDAGKRNELALAIEKAKTALLDAEIKTRQEKLEVENQKLKNQIDEQNESVKRQGDLYDILTKALEQRNKLLESSRDLAKAGTDFITGELEVLSSVEQSEYRRKELAEITESIKLRSLQKQQEFERLSLFNQIEQNRLASERELIQNRIAQGEKLSSIAGVKADIAIAQADPRNKSEAGQAKIKALQLKLQAEIDGLGLLQVQGGLIVQQAKSQETVAKAQIQQLDLKQQLEELKQEAALANALPPGKRQQAGRAIQDKIFKAFGQDGSSNFYNAAIAQSRGLAREKFGTSTNPDILAAINPELGGILDQVGGRAASAASADTRQTFNKEYGNTQNITGAFTTGVAKTPLQLPSEVQKAQSLSDQILKSSNQPVSLPGGATLRLPAPTERGVFLSLESSGKLFNEGIDKLLTYLKEQNSTLKKGSTYNIKVDAPQKTTATSGNGSETSLENVLNYAKQMAGAY